MGMSGDYKLAIDCGSTMVRVGSSIFGSKKLVQFKSLIKQITEYLRNSRHRNHRW